ncbi:acyl-ACP--UDP-N-acetylglucosamine O-acyltransferase [bacterium]|nr:acyl-ACP--UDP-N-acetylglucosamine O-acyltransferase [bacterium]
MIQVHPTAIVSPRAKIGEGVIIEPYAVIDEDVEIGEGTRIGSSTRIFAGTHIGANNKISPMVAIGGEPQDKKFAGEPTEVFIGDNNVIREFVTISRGTTATKKTIIGNGCLLMAYAHVAHDCVIGDEVILANCVELAGHVHVDDFAIMGGMVPVHQFVHIGKYCMIGGGFRVPKDVPPYLLAAGQPLSYTGLNVVGLKRRGFTSERIQELKSVYKILFRSSYNVRQAIERIETQFASEDAKAIIEFVKTSKRGLIPGRHAAINEADLA